MDGIILTSIFLGIIRIILVVHCDGVVGWVDVPDGHLAVLLADI